MEKTEGFVYKSKKLILTLSRLIITLCLYTGIESQELLLAIRDTNLRELPKGLHKMFKNVVHLSIDLRNNQLETLSPEVFYDTSEQSWERQGTKVLKGKIHPTENVYFLVI